jgi:hypothetical protein
MQQALTPHNQDLAIYERHRRLNELLRRRLGRRGWRLEFYSETSAIIVYGRPVNHWLHALLTIVSGIWLIVWLFAIGFGGERREMIFVHPSGVPEVRRLH